MAINGELTRQFPFSLRHLFQGALSREEVSSACLAMLLDGSMPFRRHFFSLVNPDIAEELGSNSWDFVVEHEEIDVFLRSGKTILLIENKIGSGAKQSGQLLRYYQRQRRAHVDAKIVAVYLAPRQIGVDEVERTRKATEFLAHPNDVAAHVSWDDVAKLPPSFQDPHDMWVREVIDHIQQAVKNAITEKYPRVGERKIVRDIMDDAKKLILEKPAWQVRRWSEQENEQVYAVHSPISLVVDLLFPSEIKPPYQVRGIVNEYGGLRLTLRVIISLPTKVKKGSRLWNWWNEFISREHDIPGVGHFVCRSNYFEFKRAIELDVVETTQKVVQTWFLLERYLDEQLRIAGIDPTIKTSI